MGCDRGRHVLRNILSFLCLVLSVSLLVGGMFYEISHTTYNISEENFTHGMHILRKMLSFFFFVLSSGTLSWC